MEQQDLEVIRDLLMYLAGVIDLAGNSSTASTFMYIRGNLKPVYDKYLIKAPMMTEAEKEQILKTNIYDVFFSSNKRLYHCLKGEDISTLGELVKLSERHLLTTPNLGKKSLKELKDELSKRGLKLSPNEF